VGRRQVRPLETVDLDGLGVELEPIHLVREELLHVLALVALELDHLASLFIVHDGAIAGKLLLHDGEDLLPGEFLGNALNRGQGLTSIALLNANMDVVLGLGLFTVLLDIGEGV